MTKSELIEALASQYPQYKMDMIEACFNTLLTGITDALTQGSRVEIRNFGALFLVKRAQRNARNPKTGQKILIPQKQALRFKCGKELGEKINSFQK